ncbi:SAM-dependent methyltransferase [Archangium sp.]|jgi:tocopherol O-methyltransferase|uniref:SAM-dependent methyltransferase n=1 Tax=Archangium sp. TaxID=1872627 RepID=UPI002EDADB32
MAALTWSLPATQHHTHIRHVQSSPPAISLREASGTNPEVVASYYDQKTASILKKYGPGPRVHFHLGYFEEPLDTAVEADVLRQRIRRAQEDVVERAARAWDASREFAGRLLDVGCGLGGGSIYWAQHCPTDVTAVTIAREHLPLISHFAQQAGVGERVHPVLSDACEVQSEEPFDAVVAMESSCYFPHERWFQHLRRLVRPGGVVCLEDTFLGLADCREPFDQYWHTRIETVGEYVRCARAAGFELENDVDLTEGTTDFWRQSVEWSRRTLAAGGVDAEEAERLKKSILWHGYFHEAWLRRGIEVWLLKFRRVS